MVYQTLTMLSHLKLATLAVILGLATSSTMIYLDDFQLQCKGFLLYKDTIQTPSGRIPITWKRNSTSIALCSYRLSEACNEPECYSVYYGAAFATTNSTSTADQLIPLQWKEYEKNWGDDCNFPKSVSNLKIPLYESYLEEQLVPNTVYHYAYVQCYRSCRNSSGYYYSDCKYHSCSLDCGRAEYFAVSTTPEVPKFRIQLGSTAIKIIFEEDYSTGPVPHGHEIVIWEASLSNASRSSIYVTSEVLNVTVVELSHSTSYYLYVRANGSTPQYNPGHWTGRVFTTLANQGTIQDKDPFSVQRPLGDNTRHIYLPTFECEAGDTTLNISFLHNSSNNIHALMGYEILIWETCSTEGSICPQRSRPSLFIPITESTVTVGNLLPSTKYVLYVRFNWSQPSNENWVINTFTTKPQLPVIEVLQTSNTLNITILLNEYVNFIPESHSIWIWQLDAEELTSISLAYSGALPSTGSNSIVVTGLLPRTPYLIKIEAGSTRYLEINGYFPVMDTISVTLPDAPQFRIEPEDHSIHLYLKELMEPGLPLLNHEVIVWEMLGDWYSRPRPGIYLSADIKNVTITGLESNTTYLVLIRASMEFSKNIYHGEWRIKETFTRKLQMKNDKEMMFKVSLFQRIQDSCSQIVLDSTPPIKILRHKSSTSTVCIYAPWDASSCSSDSWETVTISRARVDVHKTNIVPSDLIYYDWESYSFEESGLKTYNNTGTTVPNILIGNYTFWSYGERYFLAYLNCCSCNASMSKRCCNDSCSLKCYDSSQYFEFWSKPLSDVGLVNITPSLDSTEKLVFQSYFNMKLLGLEVLVIDLQEDLPRNLKSEFLEFFPEGYKFASLNGLKPHTKYGVHMRFLSFPLNENNGDWFQNVAYTRVEEAKYEKVIGKNNLRLIFTEDAYLGEPPYKHCIDFYDSKVEAYLQNDICFTNGSFTVVIEGLREDDCSYYLEVTTFGYSKYGYYSYDNYACARENISTKAADPEVYIYATSATMVEIFTYGSKTHEFLIWEADFNENINLKQSSFIFSDTTSDIVIKDLKPATTYNIHVRVLGTCQKGNWRVERFQTGDDTIEYSNIDKKKGLHGYIGEASKCINETVITEKYPEGYIPPYTVTTETSVTVCSPFTVRNEDRIGWQHCLNRLLFGYTGTNYSEILALHQLSPTDNITLLSDTSNQHWNILHECLVRGNTEKCGGLVGDIGSLVSINYTAVINYTFHNAIPNSYYQFVRLRCCCYSRLTLVSSQDPCPSFSTSHINNCSRDIIEARTKPEAPGWDLKVTESNVSVIFKEHNYIGPPPDGYEILIWEEDVSMTEERSSLYYNIDQTNVTIDGLQSATRYLIFVRTTGNHTLGDWVIKKFTTKFYNINVSINIAATAIELLFLTPPPYERHEVMIWEADLKEKVKRSSFVFNENIQNAVIKDLKPVTSYNLYIRLVVNNLYGHWRVERLLTKELSTSPNVSLAINTVSILNSLRCKEDLVRTDQGTKIYVPYDIASDSTVALCSALMKEKYIICRHTTKGFFGQVYSETLAVYNTSTAEGMVLSNDDSSLMWNALYSCKLKIGGCSRFIELFENTLDTDYTVVINHTVEHLLPNSLYQFAWLRCCCYPENRDTCDTCPSFETNSNCNRSKCSFDYIDVATKPQAPEFEVKTQNTSITILFKEHNYIGPPPDGYEILIWEEDVSMTKERSSLYYNINQTNVTIDGLLSSAEYFIYIRTKGTHRYGDWVARKVSLKMIEKDFSSTSNPKSTVTEQNSSSVSTDVDMSSLVDQQATTKQLQSGSISTPNDFTEDSADGITIQSTSLQSSLTATPVNVAATTSTVTMSSVPPIATNPTSESPSSDPFTALLAGVAGAGIVLLLVILAVIVLVLGGCCWWRYKARAQPKDKKVHKYDDEDSEHYYEIPMEINTAYGPIKMSSPQAFPKKDLEQSSPIKGADQPPQLPQRKPGHQETSFNDKNENRMDQTSNQSEADDSDYVPSDRDSGGSEIDKRTHPDTTEDDTALTGTVDASSSQKDEKEIDQDEKGSTVTEEDYVPPSAENIPLQTVKDNVKLQDNGGQPEDGTSTSDGDLKNVVQSSDDHEQMD